MAKVRQRTWRVPGQRTKRKAWGFVTVENEKQVRCFKAEWTKEDAENALAARLLKIEQEPTAKATGLTFGEGVERYIKTKARKRSLGFDRAHLNQFKGVFGADTPLVEITASRIGAWKADKLAATCPSTGRPYSAAAINRPLAALRHLLGAPLMIAACIWRALPRRGIRAEGLAYPGILPAYCPTRAERTTR